MRTYLTHLGTRGNAVIDLNEMKPTNPASPSKDSQKGPTTSKSGKGKKMSKIDTLKVEIEKQTDVLIDYLVEVRKYAYVCKTKKLDKRAIMVFKQFYVDDMGNRMTDNEDEKHSSRPRMSSFDSRK